MGFCLLILVWALFENAELKRQERVEKIAKIVEGK